MYNKITRKDEYIQFYMKNLSQISVLLRFGQTDKSTFLELCVAKLTITRNMRASLCCHTIENAKKAYPDITGCIIHSDRGSQYTSTEYLEIIKQYRIIQSMNSAGGRCHDNARCESMWERMKEELFYSRGDKSENYTMSELKTMIWRYFMSQLML